MELNINELEITLEGLYRLASEYNIKGDTSIRDDVYAVVSKFNNLKY